MLSELVEVSEEETAFVTEALSEVDANSEVNFESWVDVLLMETLLSAVEMVKGVAVVSVAAADVISGAALAVAEPEASAVPVTVVGSRVVSVSGSLALSPKVEEAAKLGLVSAVTADVASDVSVVGKVALV